MKLSENIRTQVSKYLTSRSRWQIFTDVLFAILLILMLIPQSRMSMIIAFRKLTMSQPPVASIKPPLILGEKELNWEIQTPQGEIIRFGDFSNKPIFLNIWSTHCPHCVAELDNIENLYHQYNDQVHFIMLTSENPLKVTDFLKSKGIEMPFYLTLGEVPAMFDARYIPTTYIISRGNKVVLKKTGPARWDGDKMIEYLNDLIASDR